MVELTETPVSLVQVRTEARRYPHTLLPRGGTGLSLYSAGFWGWNDVIHLERAGLRVSCVDTDPEKLWEMAALYPEGWSFYVMDVYEFAGRYRNERWDVVTVDPWTNEIHKTLENLSVWCALAKSLVTVGCFNTDPLPKIPAGWKASVFPRNSDVGWLVLQR